MILATRSGREARLGLVATIESIADRINKNNYRNETDVREAIVNRILHELGWDIYDPSTVQREYTVEKRRVDYALFTSSTTPSVFLEVKAPNSGDDGDRQLFEYAFYQGTPFAVLVNGREWSFYLPAEQGSFAERRVQKLDLLERNSKTSQAFSSATYGSIGFETVPRIMMQGATNRAPLAREMRKRRFRAPGRIWGRCRNSS